MALVHHTHCPVCGNSRINPLLTVKDHSVSQEQFVIWQCSDCSLRFTQDAPDEASIGRYYQSQDYISHTNTGKGLVNRVYQKVRNFTLEQKADLIKGQTKKTGRLLDLGAGTGAFAAKMKEKGWEVTGIEPDAGARTTAKKDFGMELYDKPELEKLAPGSFDAITLWHVLEHVHDLHPYLSLLKDLLKADGRIFIAVPNYGAVESSIYKLFWAAYDVPRHLYHFTPRSMEILLNKHRLLVAGKKPMWFDSFYISLLSSRYKNGKERWAGALISGLRSNFQALINKDRCSSIIYIVQKDQRSN